MPRTPIRLNIPTPCSQPWETMQSANDHSRYCDSCEKTVIDFSGFTNEELLVWFSNNTGPTCGKFRTEQLNGPLTLPHAPLRSKSWLLSGWLSGVLSLSLIHQAHSQTASPAVHMQQTPLPADTASKPKQAAEADSVSICGKITDEGRKLPIEFGIVTWQHKGNKITTVADEQGRFVLKIPASFAAKDLHITALAVGYEPQTIHIRPKDIQRNNEIVLSLSSSIMGDVVVVVRRSFWYKITHPFKRYR